MDFENTERKASVMQNDEALAFLNKNDANKKPADNWPEVQNPPTKQELAPNNNNN